VVQSRLNHPNWERNLLSASRCWRRDAMSMRTLLAGEREKRVHLVRYENLVSSPESVLKDICGFLGEKFEITMLGEGGQMNESCLHPEYYQQNWMTKSTTALDPSRADAWKTEYSSCELALVEKLMSSELEYFGYDVCAGKGFGWLPLLIKEYARHLLFRILIRTI
ncbi:MAG: sulfotransferase, partial [Halopseudomonas aestusnigri]